MHNFPAIHLNTHIIKFVYYVQVTDSNPYTQS